MSIPIGGWLLSKKLQFSEESSFGVPVGLPLYQQIGYDAPITISAPTNLVPLLQPGSEDPSTLVESAVDRYMISMQYRPFDTVFAKYGVNSQGGGSGWIDKSLALMFSLALGGSGETFFQAVGCRIDDTRIGGQAGGPITVRANILSQKIPVPGIGALPGTFASDPSSIPIQFKDGGVQPITI